MNKQYKCKKISIVMPCYNVDKYIKQCLNSILSQSFSDYEIIAVDDESKDNTLKILRDYEKKHPFIHVFTEKNKGAGAARNFGLSKAIGDYIWFIDPDDFIEKGALEIANKITEIENSDIYFFNFNTYDDINGNVIAQNYFKSSLTNSLDKNINYLKTTFNEKKEFLMWSYVAPWNKIYNRKFILNNNLKFDEIFSTNDRTFYFSSLIKSSSIVLTNAYLINYRINNKDSLTGTYNSSKFNNRKLAYLSTSKFIDSNDAFLNEIFFKISILDFISFYKKADDDCKFEIFKNTLNIFKQMNTENIKCIFNENDKFGFWFNLLSKSDYLLNKNQDKIIPVVFATNDKYAPYLSAALESLKQHSSKEYFYDIYIFHTTLDKRYQYVLQTQSSENIHIRTLNLTPLTNDLSMYSKGYYSVEMYYRILISEILYQYKKVLYLDCDIAIEEDIANLYNTNIDNYVIGAIQNVLFHSEMKNYVKNILKIQEEKYFNSGILLINVDKFLNNKIKDKCFELLTKYGKLACPDQDILNLSCADSVLYLDNKWNFQTQCEIYSTEEKYLNQHSIIHYITGQKPWNTEKVELSEIFWKYARLCPFYENILKTYLSSTLKISTTQKVEKQQSKTRNIINNNNMLHKNIINKNQPKKKLFITWPIRFIKDYKKIKTEKGKFEAEQYKKEEIKYIINRLLGKVDINNNAKKPVLVKYSYEYYKNIPEKKYKQEIQDWFNRNTHSKMNIDNPQGYCETIQYMKLYDSSILKSHLTDKWLAKEYVKSILGEKYIIKTLGVYNNFEEINFNKLPNQFVIKSTHGSGQIIIVKDKKNIDKNEMKEKIDSWLSRSFGYKAGFEAHYINIIPRIIIEEYVNTIDGDLFDYKLTCINGKVKLIWVDSNRATNHQRNFFDLNWNEQFGECYFPRNENIPQKPSNLSQLINLAEILSKPFSLVRCDFYILPNNEIKFGELTFTSGSGIADWHPHSYFDKFLTEKIVLPQKKRFKKLTYNQIRKSEIKFLNSLKTQGEK